MVDYPYIATGSKTYIELSYTRTLITTDNKAQRRVIEGRLIVDVPDVAKIQKIGKRRRVRLSWFSKPANRVQVYITDLLKEFVPKSIKRRTKGSVTGVWSPKVTHIALWAPNVKDMVFLPVPHEDNPYVENIKVQPQRIEFPQNVVEEKGLKGGETTYIELYNFEDAHNELVSRLRTRLPNIMELSVSKIDAGYYKFFYQIPNVSSERERQSVIDSIAQDAELATEGFSTTPKRVEGKPQLYLRVYDYNQNKIKIESNIKVTNEWFRKSDNSIASMIAAGASSNFMKRGRKKIRQTKLGG